MNTISAPSPSTEVVSFDLWLTIIKSNGSIFKAARNAMLGAVLAPDMDSVEFDTLVRTQDKQADRLAETRGHDVLFDERVNMAASAAGALPLSRERINDLYGKQTRLLAAHPPVLLDETAPQALENLSEYYRLAVVSNTGFIHGNEMRGVLRQLGIAQYFSHLIFSNEVGYAKPDERIFSALLEAADVVPEAVVHVGDNLSADVEGARRMGMQAIHFTDPAILHELAASNLSRASS